MHVTTLAGTNVTTSVLGFGTAQLMARLSRRESVRLLEAAFDAGITHIDTARLYGYGEAERAVGDLLQGRRDRITVATKFGIVPPRRSPVLRTAKAVARVITRVHPRMRQRLRAKAATLVSSGLFSPDAATRSVETSLRELRTDYLDLLLLHECRVTDLEAAGELRACLDRWVTEGKVRAYGIATDIETVVTARARFPWAARVAEFPSDAANHHVDRVSGGALITHSPFGTLLRPLADRLAGDPALARRCAELTGVECANPRALAGLLLRAARAANPSGVVVFSSTDPARIRANAEAGVGGVDGTAADAVRALLGAVPGGERSPVRQ